MRNDNGEAENRRVCAILPSTCSHKFRGALAHALPVWYNHAMVKERKSDNMSVFSDVIMTLASDAASEIEGVEVLRSGDQSKKPIRGGGVSVYFLPNDKVTVDLFVNINYGYRVPVAVAEVQQKVKSEIESATRFRVHSVNVQVMSVIFP